MDESVSGRGSEFWAKLQATHGEQIADAVRFWQLPYDEKIKVMEHRQRQLDQRMAEMRREHPGIDEDD